MLMMMMIVMIPMVKVMMMNNLTTYRTDDATAKPSEWDCRVLYSFIVERYVVLSVLQTYELQT
jgi:hypothetical protein